MNERLLVLRKDRKLTQESFGARLGVRKTAISKLEKGENNLTDQMIKLICREFNVNEEWLRDGVGSMDVESDIISLDAYAEKANLSGLEMDIVKGYLELDPEIRKTLITHFKSIFKKHEDVNSTSGNATPKESVTTKTEDPIEKELDNYRLELEAEKKGIISSALDDSKENLG
jgi:transcriptional regulator with XRE-family HTH domain